MSARTLETPATSAHGLETPLFRPVGGHRSGMVPAVILSVKTMKLAYIIDQLIALDTAAGYFDLHNCYELVRVHREGTTCSVDFAKLTGEWVKPTEPAYLTLVFEQVSFLQLSEGLQLPIGLEHIGFKEPAELELVSFMPQPGKEPVHMVLMLDDEAFIRIGAAASYCLPSPLISLTKSSS